MNDHCEHHHHHEECECEDQCECGNDCNCSCGCDCCGGGAHFQRQYLTKAEQIADLEAYLSELKLEVQAVEEHLADLQKA